MGFVDGNTMIEFKEKMLERINNRVEDALTPNLFSYGPTVTLTFGDKHYNGIGFYLGSKKNGLYIFTYANCMIPLPIYNLVADTEYKISAALCDSGGNYKVKVLTYKIDSGNNLYIYNKENYIPVGYTAYLFKLQLY